jgi:glycosyltransferase involved in cell wall biosynthesis
MIPNAVFLESSRCPPSFEQKERAAGHTILAMGRLSSEKGFDLLIKAFAPVADKSPDWSLQIWGDGPLRPQLEGRTRQRGLGGRVYFPGICRNSASVFARGDIFVLSSRYEGFPNVLLEAMTCGLPVISFDCPSGPRAVIRDGVDGLLVPPQDVARLTGAMARLVCNYALRSNFADAAREAASRFLPELIMPRWEALLDRA